MCYNSTIRKFYYYSLKAYSSQRYDAFHGKARLLIENFIITPRWNDARQLKLFSNETVNPNLLELYPSGVPCAPAIMLQFLTGIFTRTAYLISRQWSHLSTCIFRPEINQFAWLINYHAANSNFDPSVVYFYPIETFYWAYPVFILNALVLV